jgi:hypothetical protein
MSPYVKQPSRCAHRRIHRGVSRPLSMTGERSVPLEFRAESRTVRNVRREGKALYRLDVAGVGWCGRRVRIAGSGRRRRFIVIGITRRRRPGWPGDDRVVLTGLHPRHRVTRARRRARRVRRGGGRRRCELHGFGWSRRVVGGVDNRPDQQRHQQQPRDTGGDNHRLLVVPAAFVVTVHGRMLSPAGQNLPGVPGKRPLQERAEADPADSRRSI